jgi:hypothetical protein
MDLTTRDSNQVKEALRASGLHPDKSRQLVDVVTRAREDQLAFQVTRMSELLKVCC